MWMDSKDDWRPLAVRLARTVLFPPVLRSVCKVKPSFWNHRLYGIPVRTVEIFWLHQEALSIFLWISSDFMQQMLCIWQKNHAEPCGTSWKEIHLKWCMLQLFRFIYIDSMNHEILVLWLKCSFTKVWARKEATTKEKPLRWKKID